MRLLNDLRTPALGRIADRHRRVSPRSGQSVGIPDHILNKKGRLNNEEYDVIKTHPVGHSDEGIPVHECAICGPTLVLRKGQAAGEHVYCRSRIPHAIGRGDSRSSAIWA